MVSMYTIVGLGNPGKEYERTRHNVGWLMLSDVIQNEHLPDTHHASTLSADVSEGILHGEEVRMVFPHTYMNRSGGAVAKILGKNPDVTRLIVVHDDIDLPFGTIRVSVGRGAGGHNGVRSLIDSLGTKDFSRIRVGIAERTLFGTLKRPTGEALSRFVLTEFRKREAAKLPELGGGVRYALKLIITEGAEKAMQEMNANGE